MLNGHLIKIIFLTLTVISVPMIVAQDAKKQTDDSYVQRAFEIKYGDSQEFRDDMKAQAREFIWENWRQKRSAHCAFTERTIEGDPTNYHFYVGQGAGGRWQVLVEVEYNCCWFYSMEGKERKIERVRENIYYSVEQVEPGNERAISEKESRKPNTYLLRLSNKDDKEGQKVGARIL
jgi:hypothetical protein